MGKLILVLCISLTLLLSAASGESRQTSDKGIHPVKQTGVSEGTGNQETIIAEAKQKNLSAEQKKKLVKMHLIMKMMGGSSSTD